MSSHFTLTASLTFLLGLSHTAHASSITWVAQIPNNDMNTPTNWSPNIVPGSSDDAVFDSTIPGISTNPTSTSLPFSVSSFHFLNRASNFSFHFNNAPLTLNGAGITGNNTNCTLSVTNVDNSGFPGNLLSFLGSTGASGSSHLISSNSATLTGNQSNTSLGSINSNIYSSGAFTMSDGGSLIASNTGVDHTNGTGNVGTANTGSSQLRFDQTFTAGNNVFVSASNEGAFSGTNTAQSSATAIVGGSQFISSGAFQVGDNFSFQGANTGNDSSLGVGLSNIGQLNSAQMLLQTTATLGNNCSITLSNTGINSSQATSSDFIGYLNDQQFFVGSTFQAGNHFTLTVTNTGTDTSQGNGESQVAAINSNSGTTGNQVLFQRGCALGSYAAFNVSNNGTYSGTSTSNGSNVALMNLQQIVIGDFTAPGSFAFHVGDAFTLNVSNSGNDSASGLGFDAVGTVSTDQVTFYTPCSIGNNAALTITNSGNYSGYGVNTPVNVGSTGGSQLNGTSAFQAGDGFTLNISNSGVHTATGIGNNFIGDLINGQQASFGNGLTLGDTASIHISNSGSDSSNTLNRNQTGTLLGLGKQLLIKELFQAGDDLTVVITNSGVDASTGASGNYTGFINNNTADQTASQLHLDGGGSVGNHASLSLSNSGTYQGTNTGTMTVGVLAGEQFYAPTDFQAGNAFSLEATNLGILQASGQSYHIIGTIGTGGQIACGGNCDVGENASMILVNNGINHDATGLLNTIGHVNGSQMNVIGNFSAEKNLTLTATNTAMNAGDSSNIVGYINGSQVSFQQSCTLDDGSLISAFNSGTLANSQIAFAQGFNITSGKVMLQAVNEGTLGSFGIHVQGNNAGGNADILLQNSSLYIESTPPSFTIGGLSGDSTSFVKSQPNLIIHTDTSTQAEFAGSIQDFPASSSTLMKTGAGTETLSGVNTYSGLTTVEEGTLTVNGSLAGNVLINPLGTFKGSGTVRGTLTNTGVTAPGESIGTLTVLSDYINNSGTYDVEVNGSGQSDLLDVTGSALLNGGLVVVTSADGTYTFQQPYTIVTAGGGVVGTYSQVTSSSFITPALSYDANNVYMTIASDLLRAAKGCNQLGVARNLDQISHPNAVQSLLISSIANLPLKAAQEALESLSGFQYTNDAWATELSIRRFLRRLYDPLRSLVNGCAPCRDWTIWLEMRGGFSHLHGKHAHKLHTTSYEVTSGIQKTFCCNLTLGLAYSHEQDHRKYRSGREKGHSTFAAAYGLYRANAFYGLVDAAYGHRSSHLKRTIEAGRLSYQVNGKPIASSPTFYGEVGLDWEKDHLLVQPFFGIQAGKVTRKRIKEKNPAGFALTIDKQDWTATNSRLGLHLSVCHFCNCVDASLDLAWDQRLSSHKNTTTGRFQEFGNPFPICGNRLATSGFDYALTLTTCLYEGFTGYVELGGETWRHANTLDALAGIQFSW